MRKLIFTCLLSLMSTSALAIDQDTKSVKQDIGSGWVVAPYFIVTNNHVVTQSDYATVTKRDKSRINAVVVVRDVVNDLALLKVEDSRQLPPAIPLSQNSPLMGEQVFTIGYPHPDVMGSNPKLTVGIVNALTGMANDPRTLQISTPLQAGNSGGPLLNMKGEAVGIVTSKLNAMKMFEWTGDIPQNVNYAVKLNYLRALLESIHDPDQAKIKILPSKQNTLVNLTQQVQDSIVLIKSVTSPTKRHHSKEEQVVEKADDSVTNEVKRLAMFVYMENAGYGLLSDQDDTATYSRNTARAIDSIIKHKKYEHLAVTHLQHNSKAKWRYYDAFKARGGKRLCAQHNVDYLLAVKNAYDIITPMQEDLEFVLQDCVTNKYLQHSYTISHRLQDGFYFETDIRTAAKSFLFEYLNSY